MPLRWPAIAVITPDVYYYAIFDALIIFRLRLRCRCAAAMLRYVAIRECRAGALRAVARMLRYAALGCCHLFTPRHHHGPAAAMMITFDAAADATAAADVCHMLSAATRFDYAFDAAAPPPIADAAALMPMSFRHVLLDTLRHAPRHL